MSVRVAAAAPGFCRDCLAAVDETAATCPRCLSRRLIRHPELVDLSLAHIDCDAFYATVEKRDDPRLKELKIGIQPPGGPTHDALVQRGLAAQIIEMYDYELQIGRAHV